MNKTIEEMIKDILDQDAVANESLFVDFKPATLREYQLRLLTNLVQKEREEAVRGFIKYLFSYSIALIGIEWLSDGHKKAADGHADEYLSQTKGGTDE